MKLSWKHAVAGSAALVAGAAYTVAHAPRCRLDSGVPTCSPGSVNPMVTQENIQDTICRSGWTATVRPSASYTNALKAQQMHDYGFMGDPHQYEEDHRVPLEVGGHPRDPANLFPEPWNGPRGAHAKDALENYVHRQICAGGMTLAQGRAIFLGDWWAWAQREGFAR